MAEWFSLIVISMTVILGVLSIDVDPRNRRRFP